MTQPAKGSFPNVLRVGICAIATTVALSAAHGAHQENPRFQGEIELVKVTATVTDDGGSVRRRSQKGGRSVVSAGELRQAIMESDALVYALGRDDRSQTQRSPDSRGDLDALCRITDETGGRTEAVRDEGTWRRRQCPAD
jgi:hypothetical protein